MSDAIRRNEFVSTFTQANPDGFFARADLDVQTRGLLAKAGVSQQDLYEMAGQDGVIRGEEELGQLFARLDEHDRDGSARTFQDGTVRAAYLALLHDAKAAEGTQVRSAGRDASPTETPRGPSAWARAHHREVMIEMKRRADGLGEAEVEDPAGALLRGISLLADAADLAEGAGVGLEVGSIGGTAAFAGAGPILALGTALYEIGHANEAAAQANAKRVQVRSFAGGIAAGLDPARGMRVPSDAGERAYFLRGRALVSQMTPAERKNLEDVLVLARQHATIAGVDYDARTYQEAVMDVYEGTWNPAGQ